MDGRWRFPGLTFKLAVALIGTVVVISGSLCLLSAYFHRRALERLMVQEADRVTDVVHRSTRFAMLNNSRDEIYKIMDSIGTQPGIVRLRIYDEQGLVVYSTDKAEIGHSVDKKAEACFACHQEGQPLTRLNRPDRVRVFREPTGGRVVGVINAIDNEPACYNAPCHYHPSNQQILGVLDVDVSLKDVDSTIAGLRNRALIGVAFNVLIVALVAFLFVFILVDRPLKAVMAGTRRVADGDMDHPILVRSRDELGALAQSFNDMTRRLKEAMEVVRHYNRTLQSKVEEKTAELRQAQEHMLRIDRMATVGRLTAVIAHEINNPLSGIRTYAKLLQKRAIKEPGVGEEEHRYLELIESEATRCGEIVNSLLQFSRKSPIKLEPQDISGLTAEALRLVRHRLDLQSVTVNTHLQERLPRIHCSGQQVIQALLAVFINACEAMPSEGTLIVSTGSEEGEKGVWVRVEDTGVGIDSETLEHIFEPFFSTKEEVHGVGLGLAVVYSIVQRHGGRIDVESTVGKGSEFTLHFPVLPPQAGASPKEVPE